MITRLRSSYQGFCLLLILATVAWAVQGCAQLGVPTPDTFNKKAAVAIATITEVRGTAAELVRTGKITPTQAEDVQRQADAARDGVTAARKMAASGDLTNADTRLAAVQAALQALHTYLIQRQQIPNN